MSSKLLFKCSSSSAKILVVVAISLGSVRAGAPDWLRAAAATPAGAHEAGTPAVILLDETTTTIKDNGEIVNQYRHACRILNPQGRDHANLVLAFERATRVSSLAGWSISTQGKELEIKGKDAVETTYSSENLYDDSRRIIMRIPGADPGSVIGYEYEQKERPWMLEDIYRFQEDVPVRRARVILQLPRSWEFRASWRNYPEIKPKEQAPNRWVWELENIAPLKPERSMPPAPAVVARLFVSYLPPRDNGAGSRLASTSWREIGIWYHQLTAERRMATAAIRQKVSELTAGVQDPIKVRRLVTFAQREIRYVAIEIGIGGFQPHAAADVFAARYGDCKDKATLLATMLHEIGVDSYYVLVNTDRGVIDKSFPTARTFNHVVLAFRPPPDPDLDFSTASIDAPHIGKLVVFDPTDPLTPFGSLPAALQANAGLLVTADGGQMVDLPLAPPSANHLVRKASLRLDSDGTLSGDVEEMYSGELAARRRSMFLETAGVDRAGLIEKTIAPYLDGKLEKASLVNLAHPEADFGIRYSFRSPNYAKHAGDLLLVRPRVLGRKSGDSPDAGRKLPMTFPITSEETDTLQIVLPDGYAVDEAPPAVSLEYPFGTYTSSIQTAGKLIQYERKLSIRQLLVPAEALPDLSKFYRTIEAGERNSVVLKQR